MRKIESIRYPEEPTTPLPRSKHIFTGESDDCFTNGSTYCVIGSGVHWHKQFGFGIWMTDDEYPNNPYWDEDYGVFIKVEFFNDNFFAH